MNQEYKERVKRHLEAGGDPKYVNVKRKADARHESSAKSKALEKKKETQHDVQKRNNRTMMEIDKHNRSWNGKEYTHK